jgi:DNA-binding winged helix-turn-helix (wHTH) protein
MVRGVGSAERHNARRNIVRIAFEDYMFDSEARQLSRGSEVLHISPKSFHFLKALLQNRPKALSKANLRRLLWPDTSVDESNLATLAAEIRGALGDDARHPRFLRTVYGFGYGFCGEVRDVSCPAAMDQPGTSVSLRLVLGDREVRLSEGEQILGREGEILIDSIAASRRHARIVVSGREAMLEDLSSKNGTMLNGERIERPMRLRDGDRIHIALVTMIFRSIPAAASTAPAHEL